MEVRRIFGLFRTLHRPVTTLARRVAQRINFRELSCRATFGLDDPAETGMLSGFLYAAFAPLTRSPAVSIRLHPVFHEQVFAYRVRGSLGVTVGRMIIPVIRGSLGVTVGRMIIPVITFLCDRAVRGMIVRHVHGSSSSSDSVPRTRGAEVLAG
jgi:hypothetical protein